MNKELIKKELDVMFPNADCELTYNHDYELLIKVMLSSQTTDKRVNMVTKDLFLKYDTLEKLDKLSVEEIFSYIKSIGFANNKSKHFKGIVSKIKELGYVPNNREFLESLPGVGRKTASVVIAHLFDSPNFAVDTHVFRVSKRLSITNEKDDILKTEKKLKKYFDTTDWNRVNSQLVLFGRYICTSIKPKCDSCKFNHKCKKTS